MEKAFAGLGSSLLFIDRHAAARLQWYLLSIRSTRAACSVQRAACILVVDERLGTCHRARGMLGPTTGSWMQKMHVSITTRRPDANGNRNAENETVNEE